MPYNSLITRNDANALIPVEASREILQGATQKSVVMQLGRRLPNMTAKQRRTPVLAALATAYFVSGDTGIKQTTELAWENKFLEAEEIAAIVPIPEAVLDDSEYDIWANARPQIEEAIALALDEAVLTGTNKPASWPGAIVDDAATAGNTVALAGAMPTYDELLGVGGLLAALETDGFAASGVIASMGLRGGLRTIKGSDGHPIFKNDMQSPTRYALDGVPIAFVGSKVIDPAHATAAKKALAVAGDFAQLVYALRQDITYKLLDQATITDNTGAIIYNLAQQDMVALRVVFRIAVQIANPINRQNPTSTRYPFSVLKPA